MTGILYLLAMKNLYILETFWQYLQKKIIENYVEVKQIA